MTTEENKYKRRLGFKISIKSKWIYTSWFFCKRFEVPYDISEMFKFLQQTLESDLFFYKIEVRKNIK